MPNKLKKKEISENKQINKIEKFAIEIKNLEFSYDNEKVFTNISLSIDDGDFVAIVGPNGAGKSTLIKLILGLLTPNSGVIKILNTTFSKLENKNLIAYVPQIMSFEKNFPISVKELLELKGKLDTKITSSLEITDLLEKQFINLSGGQKQRVLIAFVLMSKPRLLILDEPTIGIDPKSQKNFYDLLKKINEEEKITILLVTHDVGIIPSVAKKVLCINHNICCMGHSKDAQELLKQVYEEDFIVHHHNSDNHNNILYSKSNHIHHHHDLAGEKCCNHKH